MKRIAVHYCGWGQDWLLGHLADDGQNLLFEYSPQALQAGLALSPLHLSLRAQTYGGFPAHQHRLPGLIADSLPDGWGLLLMDRLFRQQKLPAPSPLDRLAFMADRAMGALRFEPVQSWGESEPDWGLLHLAQESAKVLAGEASSTLQALALTGGSPQGARPKALVQYDAATERISTLSDAPGQPWLVKFPAQGEHPEVCAIEQLYAELARDCGLDMPPSFYLRLSPKLAAFAVQRFDREQGQRVPIHSLAGLLHADFRQPSAVDYSSFLRATRLLTRDEREVEKAYARAVFNVLFHNRDDHPKNFAWRLNAQGRWQLAPAFDLTYSNGPGGQHHMDICGHGHRIEQTQLLQLAQEGGVQAAYAQNCIAQMLQQAAQLPQRLAHFSHQADIRKSTQKQLLAHIKTCAQTLQAN